MTKNLDKPVFILGLHRTGSTLLKNMLDQSPALAMATDEMDISNPWRRGFEDFFSTLDKKDAHAFATEIVRAVYERTPPIYGSFWRDFPGLKIGQKAVFERLVKSDRTQDAVVSILLDEYRQLQQKPRVGVKYPLHFSRVKRLREWFPDAKLLFLYRDARAVCASKVNDEKTRERKQKAGIFSFLIHYATLSLFIFDYVWFSRVYRKNKGGLAIFPVCFERLVADPETVLKQICRFCEIPFDQAMLKAVGKPSSHAGRKGRAAGNAVWRHSLPYWDRLLITLLTKKSMKDLGYTFNGTDAAC